MCLDPTGLQKTVWRRDDEREYIQVVKLRPSTSVPESSSGLCSDRMPEQFYR